MNQLLTRPAARRSSGSHRPAIKFSIALIAVLAVSGTSRPASAQTYRAFTFALTGDGTNNSGFSGGSEDSGDTYLESPIPKNISLQGYSKTFSGPQGDVKFNAAGAVNFRGFYSTGTYAYGSVQNAYYPTTPAPGKEPPFGYYVIAGGGSWTKNTFVSPEALTDAYANFHWHVTGNTNGTDFGTANSRLDFAVTTGVSGFDDLYNPNVTPNILTKFGPGSYSYYTPIALNTSLDFLFWGSSFWEVDVSDLATLGTSHRDIHGYANFFNTFEIDGIDLTHLDGTPITEWSLLDQNGNTVFNQNGRLGASAVPEPGSVALLAGLGVSGLSLLARRRRRK